MRSKWKLLAVLCLFTLNGCVVKNIGSNLKYDIQGEYYLEQKAFNDGVETFAKLLVKDPDNSRIHYYYGRFLLAEASNKEALFHLQKAVATAPKKSAYHFWLGVAYGETGDTRRERRSYQQALKIDPNNALALIHLGHNLLRHGKYEKSLALYQKSLDIFPTHPQALYNRAYILHKLKRTPEEHSAWLTYLDYYPAGTFARLAVNQLNLLRDYSYRNHHLGIRTVTLTDIGFVPFTSEIEPYALPSLDLVGSSVANMQSGTLNILMYQLNNRNLAKKRAIAIRSYLYKKFPSLMDKNRIRLSWFDTPEKLVLNGKVLLINQSVSFFLTGIDKTKRIRAKKKKQIRQ